MQSTGQPIGQATERISLRTTPHAKAVIEQASSRMGVSMSHFILTTMYQKSLELLKDGEVWALENDDDKALIKELLDNPKSPTPKMRELMAKHKDFPSAI